MSKLGKNGDYCQFNLCILQDYSTNPDHQEKIDKTKLFVHFLSLYGPFWNFMALFRPFQHFLALFGTFWHVLAICCTLCYFLALLALFEPVKSFWELLEFFITFLHFSLIFFLQLVGTCWHFLALFQHFFAPF